MNRQFSTFRRSASLKSILSLLGVAMPSFAMASFAIVDTGQTQCYDNAAPVACPAAGQAFYGQDAQYAGQAAHYTVSVDGLTVQDHVTGLIWQRSPDRNGDGVINADDKLTVAEAEQYAATLNAQQFGGYRDWRLPTLKELYSLIDFRGTDPSGDMNSDGSNLTPFLDTDAFAFGYGDVSAGERIIDAQYATQTRYVSTTMNGNATMFGVNFADGRIKGYPVTGKNYYAIYVRDGAYGQNQFVDHGDGTVSDQATGLMWMKADSGAGMNWQEALAWAQAQNAANSLGYGDWRLPNAKELQGIVDYTRSPDTTGSAALDTVFDATRITNEAGQADYPFYWTNTTFANTAGFGDAAVYVAFGRALGYMNGTWMDVHGAGAQRSDPKSGDPADYPFGRGPQGDAIRINNFVRLVRSGSGPVDNSAHTLTVAQSGTGSGTVVSNPAGIDCGAACSADFVADAEVTLTATPAAGSTFAGWQGDCTNASGDCTVALSQARAVQAVFNTTAGNAVDLGLILTGTPHPVRLGDRVTYTLTVKNAGSATAASVLITAAWPSGPTFLGAGPNCARSGTRVTCSAGSLANGGSTAVRLTLRTTRAGAFTVTGETGSATTDANPADNAASLVTTVQSTLLPPPPR